MSKARDLADLAKNANDRLDDVATSDGALSNRNVIINGNFSVWQRGTTLNTTDYSADRWMQWMTNSGVSNRNVNCTKQTGGPLGKNSSYIRYAPQVVDTGMEKFAWGQKIEKINLDNIQSGQQMTLSFWIKKEQDLPTDNNMDIQILRPDNVDGWSSGYLSRGDENIDQTLASISFNSLSTNWTKYSYTFIPGDAVLDNGMAVYWHIGDNDFNLNNTNPLVSFTGVQLEVGDTATPFEHRSYGDELQRCQRYFEKGTGHMMYKSSDDTSGWYQYKVTKRANPTLTFTAPGGTTSQRGYYYSTNGSDHGEKTINEINSPGNWSNYGWTDFTDGWRAGTYNFTPTSANDALMTTSFTADAEL